MALGTIGAISAVATVAGAAVSAIGAIQSGKAQQKAAEYNAQVAEQAALAARQKAAYDEAAHRRELARMLSAQRAAYGASGVDVSVGTPLLVMADTVQEGELDALAIRYGGEVGASRQLSAAQLSRMTGKQARTASYYQAGSSLLTGAASAATAYSTLNKPK